MPAVQFAVQSYTARSKPLSAQRLVNLFAETAPSDAYSPVVLLGAPGIKAFGDMGGNGPVRGLKAMGGVLYAVSENTLYSVDSAGTGTSSGTIPGSGPVFMETNGLQLMIVVPGDSGYIYTVADGLVKITDSAFPVPNSLTYQDGYFIVGADDARFYVSALLDGLSWDALDFASAEGQPDDLVTVKSNHRELWLMGEQTAELWYNSGATFPFERFQGTFVERGCAARHSVADDDNTIFWLGDDRVVYRADGYNPQRISTHAIEQAISDYVTVSDAIAFTYTQDGHKFYVLTFPTEKATFVYDVATQLWHERESYLEGRWRANCYERAYGKHLVGDFESGKIGELDMATYKDWTEPLPWEAVSPPQLPEIGNHQRARMPRFEVLMEMGVGLTSGQGSDPQIWLDWSDDGGHSWSTVKPQRGIGKKGEYTKRAIWRRLGAFRQRYLRVRGSDPVKRNLIAAWVDIEPLGY